MKILVTGSAGFIGSNLVLRLLDSKEPLFIVGFDNLNDYYDPSLKEYRLGLIDAKVAQRPEHKYTFVKGDLADKPLIDKLFEDNHFDIVVNLAAFWAYRFGVCFVLHSSVTSLLCSKASCKTARSNLKSL